MRSQRRGICSTIKLDTQYTDTIQRNAVVIDKYSLTDSTPPLQQSKS